MELRLPDIGDFSDVPVIEVHVAPGDQLTVDDPVVTLESDKATMDVPAAEAGVVSEVRVSVGDTVSEGDVLLTFEPAAAAPAVAPAADQQAARVEAPAAAPAPAAAAGRQADVEAEVLVLGA
ncbi:MAG TPA: biotin/lipoyl-containing protein, partial [Actinomycetes bacterium]